MPQLDKYIFLDSVLQLTLVFFIFYIFMRFQFVPTISFSLKFRNEISSHLNSSFSFYDKFLQHFKNFFQNELLGLQETFVNILTMSFVNYFQKIDGLISRIIFKLSFKALSFKKLFDKMELEIKRFIY